MGFLTEEEENCIKTFYARLRPHEMRALSKSISIIMTGSFLLGVIGSSFIYWLL